MVDQLDPNKKSHLSCFRTEMQSLVKKLYQTPDRLLNWKLEKHFVVSSTRKIQERVLSHLPKPITQKWSFLHKILLKKILSLLAFCGYMLVTLIWRLLLKQLLLPRTWLFPSCLKLRLGGFAFLMLTLRNITSACSIWIHVHFFFLYFVYIFFTEEKRVNEDELISVLIDSLRNKSLPGVGDFR